MAGRCRACRAAPPGMLHCHRCGVNKLARGNFYPTRLPGKFLHGCKACRREAARDRAHAVAGASRTRSLPTDVFDAIRALSERSPLRCALVSDVARHVGCSRRTIIRIAHVESEAGTIEITRDPTDTRAWRLRVVEVGAR